MADRLQGLRVAILATDGVEQIELEDPRQALEQEGAEVSVIAPKDGSIQARKHLEPGDTFPVDMTAEEASPEQFDALLLPGGVANPDALRMDKPSVQFVRSFADEDKPIAVICHGPWTLVEADAVRGKRITSYPSLQTDLRNAGAEWVDEEVVVDGRLVSSRKPDDLPAFNRNMIETFAKAKSGANQVPAKVGKAHD